MSPLRPTLQQRLAELHPRPIVARGILVVAAVLLALLHLFQNALEIQSAEMWLDEASTYMVAQYPFPRLLTLPIEFHSQPPLYYVLLHFLTKVSSTELAIRGLSWASGLLFLAFVLFELNELRLVSRLVIGLLFVSNKVTVYLSQEARPYGLAVLATFVATLLFTRLLRRPRDRGLALAYTLSTVTMAYLLAFDAWALMAHGLSAVVVILVSLKRRGLRRTARDRWRLVASLAVISAAYYPYYHLVTEYQHHTTKPLREILAEAFKSEHFIAVLRQYAEGPAPLPYLLWALIVVGVLGELRKKNRTILVWLLLFFGQIAFVHGFLLGRVPASYRYILPVFPAFLLGVGLGLHHLGALRLPRLWPLVLGLLMFLVVTRALPFGASLRSPEPVDNWRKLHAEMKKVPGKKAIFFDTGFYAQMLEYVARGDEDFTFLSDGYPGLDEQRSAGGRGMTPAYIEKALEQQAPSQRCFFYATDRRSRHKSQYESVFVPEMARRGYEKVFTLESGKVADPYHDRYVVRGFCRQGPPG